MENNKIKLSDKSCADCGESLFHAGPGVFVVFEVEALDEQFIHYKSTSTINVGNDITTTFQCAVCGKDEDGEEE